MTKLVAMLRVKDGILFIEEWLNRMAVLVDEIVAVDNGSTDGTLEILQRHPKVVVLEQTEGFDEGRDKILAYERVRERKPDWVIWLDIDEVFEQRLTRRHLDELMTSTRVTRYFFRRLHMVDRAHFNADFHWLKISCWPDRIMWREQATGYFENVKFNNGLIRGIHGRTRLLHFRIKHLGYVDKEYVQRKTNIYRTIDPAMEDTYARMMYVNPTKWKWYEYKEDPVRVGVQNTLLDVCLMLLYILAIPVRIRRVVLEKFRRIWSKTLT
jgi:glycosyltransferase involved in cell wall biosynthesis